VRTVGNTIIYTGSQRSRHKTLQYSTVQYNTVQYHTVVYCSVQYGTVQYITQQDETIEATWQTGPISNIESVVCIIPSPYKSAGTAAPAAPFAVTRNQPFLC